MSSLEHNWTIPKKNSTTSHSTFRNLSYIFIYTCKYARLFTEALLVITASCKQPECILIEINRQWHSNTMEYNATIKENVTDYVTYWQRTVSMIQLEMKGKDTVYKEHYDLYISLVITHKAPNTGWKPYYMPFNTSLSLNYMNMLPIQTI